MKSIIKVFKHNLIPLVFFSVIAIGILSFLDYRQERINFVKEIVLYNREQRGIIQKEAQNVSNLSLISKGTKTEYDDIIEAFDYLDEAIEYAEKNIPRQELALIEYDDYIEETKKYYEAYSQSSIRNRELFVQKERILPQINIFKEQKELSIENSTQLIQVLEYMEAKNNSEEEETAPSIIKKFIVESVDDNTLSIEEKEAYAALIQEKPIFIPEGFHLVQFTDIDNNEVYDAFSGLESSESFLRAAFNIKALD